MLSLGKQSQRLRPTSPREDTFTVQILDAHLISRFGVSVHVGVKKPGFSYRKPSLATKKHRKPYYFACGAPKTRFLVYPLNGYDLGNIAYHTWRVRAVVRYERPTVSR